MPHRRPTLADVAAEAGVSKAAVSRVINDAPGVAPATRERVRQVIARLNVPPALAASFYEACDRVVAMAPSGPAVPYVGMENAEGAYAAVMHLHETGHRRIAALHGQPDNPDAAARREGYLRAVRELGLPDISATGKFRREAGYELIPRLLAEEPGVDAVFVAAT